MEPSESPVWRCAIRSSPHTIQRVVVVSVKPVPESVGGERPLASWTGQVFCPELFFLQNKNIGSVSHRLQTTGYGYDCIDIV